MRGVRFQTQEEKAAVEKLVHAAAAALFAANEGKIVAAEETFHFHHTTEIYERALDSGLYPVAALAHLAGTLHEYERELHVGQDEERQRAKDIRK